MNTGKIIIITAPSGSGKTTLVKRLLEKYPKLAFSISACTRQPRPNEVNGRDYYFYTEEEFKDLVDKDAFVEWEMVYTGKYYGTLKSEVQRIWDNGQTPLVDIDVQGAIATQKKYPHNSLSLFIQAPSIQELRQRLEKRGTETPESLEERIKKAESELTFAHNFDTIIVNDDLDKATMELIDTIEDFISGDNA
ncbi:MAG: guanylate kinase [Chitinophagaceae bacterium]|nr:guanylate kinase [Chitinophagaceae bacterium]MCB9046382.1 guanylate kinase [Chitinophagales bacterium]